MSCKHKTEVYSRVVGYYRPVQQWNKGKQAEYADRVPFKLAGKLFPAATATTTAAATATLASLAAVPPGL
jgi:hypothetical protein